MVYSCKWLSCLMMFMLFGNMSKSDLLRYRLGWLIFFVVCMVFLKVCVCLKWILLSGCKVSLNVFLYVGLVFFIKFVMLCFSDVVLSGRYLVLGNLFCMMIFWGCSLCLCKFLSFFLLVGLLLGLGIFIKGFVVYCWSMLVDYRCGV